jgi:nicotinamide-nucleotide amidase
MPEVNRRQAMLPTGSTRIDNHHGTAPGFALRSERALFVCMPGVPREMKAMFVEGVQPLLAERLPTSPGRLVTLRTIGVGESNLQEMIGAFEEPDVVLSYRTMLPENHVKLRFGPTVGEARVREVVERVAAAVQRWVFTVEGYEGPTEGALAGLDLGGGSHTEVIARQLAAAGHTLATAESCTGGRIAAACTALPGASAWFLEGRVTYSNAAKVAQLGVSEATLAAHGAVSEPVAREMADGLRERSGATFAIGVTGIAGPGGATADKPVGTVHIALSSPEGTRHRALRLPGDRERIQRLAVASALELLRRSL